MTSDTAVRTIGLGKMYYIGAQRGNNRTLRDMLAEAVQRPLERIRHPGVTSHASEEFWALKGVDLEVKHGEVLGVIGPNGSGKSTLLKVLSHITEPTEGRAEISGRVASLLEVGTGFHPELTGRENIQLNGAILGMTRAEISSRFDEIVEFSELGRFLDTPVKRYSSGMYIRLAFSVAAHLQPEILIVDEVLAVGDADFQKKCLGKMGDVAKSGRTVVFVSHNLAAIRALCTRAALLAEGHLVRDGDVANVVEAYLASVGGSGDGSDPRQSRRPIDKDGVHIVEAQLLGVEQDKGARTALNVEMTCAADQDISFNIEWRIITTAGDPVVFGAPEVFRGEKLRVQRGETAIALQIQDVPLASGQYYLEIKATQAFRRILDRIQVPFGVDICDPGGIGFNFYYYSEWAPTFAHDHVEVLSRDAESEGVAHD